MQANVHRQKKRWPGGWLSESWTGKRGIRPLDQRIQLCELQWKEFVTHACFNPTLFLETMGLATPKHCFLVMLKTHYLCVTIAPKTTIYSLPSISDVETASWVVSLRERFVIIWLFLFFLHAVRWHEEANRLRWLRPFRVGNEEILH